MYNYVDGIIRVSEESREKEHSTLGQITRAYRAAVD
jgi:hypothetical protein